MDKILNLTQHIATPEQVAAGVIEPADKAAVQALLTFEVLPTEGELRARARQLAEILYNTEGCYAAMIGGAPYFMAILEAEIAMLAKRVGGKYCYPLKAVYAFSVRASVEETMPDGSVKKTQVFKHAGFIPALTRAVEVTFADYVFGLGDYEEEVNYGKATYLAGIAACNVAET